MTDLARTALSRCGVPPNGVERLLSLASSSRAPFSVSDLIDDEVEKGATLHTRASQHLSAVSAAFRTGAPVDAIIHALQAEPDDVVETTRDTAENESEAGYSFLSSTKTSSSASHNPFESSVTQDAVSSATTTVARADHVEERSVPLRQCRETLSYLDHAISLRATEGAEGVAVLATLDADLTALVGLLGPQSQASLLLAASLTARLRSALGGPARSTLANYLHSLEQPGRIECLGRVVEACKPSMQQATEHGEQGRAPQAALLQCPSPADFGPE
jgi:hypothetical protein